MLATFHYLCTVLLKLDLRCLGTWVQRKRNLTKISPSWLVTVIELRYVRQAARGGREEFC